MCRKAREHLREGREVEDEGHVRVVVHQVGRAERQPLQAVAPAVQQRHLARANPVGLSAILA